MRIMSSIHLGPILFLISTLVHSISSFRPSHRWSTRSSSIRGGNLNEIDVPTIDVTKSIPSKPWPHDAYAESLNLYDQLMSCEDPQLSPLINSALSVLSDSYRYDSSHELPFVQSAYTSERNSNSFASLLLGFAPRYL